MRIFANDICGVHLMSAICNNSILYPQLSHYNKNIWKCDALISDANHRYYGYIRVSNIIQLPNTKNIAMTYLYAMTIEDDNVLKLHTEHNQFVYKISEISVEIYYDERHAY